MQFLDAITSLSKESTHTILILKYHERKTEKHFLKIVLAIIC